MKKLWNTIRAKKMVVPVEQITSKKCPEMGCDIRNDTTFAPNIVCIIWEEIQKHTNFIYRQLITRIVVQNNNTMFIENDRFVAQERE